ncbi:hypothetical protein GT347_20585 [Xylophilus rhododendri]|uniref:Oligosaccharide repeat unit polymerase n=1 Tax=Xylophilus rhododendri TaxID=2697032 RepID=A0A857JB05_9BURK|nr:hypothetical protein [Xylophilus rhododendri]QHJ00163.1 hypothetical protein GT347_20585 [Xylophilus rhododendri]
MEKDYFALLQMPNRVFIGESCGEKQFIFARHEWLSMKQRISFPWKSPSAVWFVFAPWILVIFLYWLDLTIFSEASIVRVLRALAPGLIPTALVLLLFALFNLVSTAFKRRPEPEAIITVDLGHAYKMNRVLLKVFYAILVLEFLYFGQIPLISMMLGSDVTHFDFGIPGLHGLLYAIGAAVATISFSLYLLTQQRKYLFQVFMVLLVFLLLVTRKMFLVVGLQMLILYIGLVGWRRIGLISLCILAVVYIFGFIGDIRTGREQFLDLAGLKVDYPEWLPSGFIWVYIYGITPIANYVNMTELLTPTFNFVDLFSWAIPPRILSALFGVELIGGFENDWQVSGAFNVASGFANIFPTLGGQVGIIIFATFVGLLIGYFAKVKSFYHMLSLCTIYASSVLMVFNNNLMSLNVAFQFVVYLICSRLASSSARGQTRFINGSSSTGRHHVKT